MSESRRRIVQQGTPYEMSTPNGGLAPVFDDTGPDPTCGERPPSAMTRENGRPKGSGPS